MVGKSEDRESDELMCVRRGKCILIPYYNSTFSVNLRKLLLKAQKEINNQAGKNILKTLTI